MEWWQAFILGLVQGLTEFLPVSSSGHLVLVSEWLGVSSESSVFFAVMLHLATLISVCVVLRKEIWALIRRPISKPVLCLIIASIPAAVIGFAFNDFFESMFTGSQWLWLFFLISAIILLTSDFVGKYYERKGIARQSKELTIAEDGTIINPPLFSTIGYGTAIAMGVAQACAILPGVSRSGSTIAGGVISKGKRSEVARFSFLMSLVVILGSVLLEGGEMIIDKTPLDIPVVSLLVGMLAAMVSGYIAVKWMLRLVEKCQMKWFSLYLVLMSILVIVNNFVGIW